MHPRTRYAKSGDVHLAYQLFGEGSVNLVFVPGFISQIENYWDEPGFARWLNRLGTFARVVLFDKRGTGLSDRLDELPGMDLRMDDVGVVMDAVEFDKAVVMGISEGGSLAALFAAHHPDRCQGLVLYGAFASFKSWFPTEESLEELFQYIGSNWGSGASIPNFAPSKADDPAFIQWWGKFERLGATPGDAIKIMRMNSKIEITGVLPSIQVPTLVIHRTDDVTIEVEAGRTLGECIPNARYVELPGADHLPWVGDFERITMEIEEFITGSKSIPIIDRVLVTVMFSDIVGSTIKAEALGDERWQDLMTTHNAVLRTELERFRGNEVRFTGDGFLTTFDGPARAIKCAMAISRRLRPLGIEVRLGLHTGEVEFHEGEIHGIAVNMTARIGALAGASEILVSRTVKDLIAGSGIQLTHHGQHEFKGLSESMDVYLVKG
jgi:class 3 adenylate cyclase